MNYKKLKYGQIKVEQSENNNIILSTISEKDQEHSVVLSPKQAGKLRDCLLDIIRRIQIETSNDTDWKIANSD